MIVFVRKKSVLQCLTWQGPNYNIYKEKVRITMFVRIKSEFERIRLKLQCFKGKGPNCNIRSDKVPITLFQRIRSELQCL